jgi:uncharacterized protein YhfF
LDRHVQIEACWARYRRSLPAGSTAPVDYFEAAPFGGEGEGELADELAALIVRGTKTATSTLLRSYEDGNHPRERVGDCCVVLDSNGCPCCVIEITEVSTRPFGEVDAAFAREYGEGDRTLAWWREHLGAYYAGHSAATGWSFSGQTPLVCKRFRVIHPCAETASDA